MSAATVVDAIDGNLCTLRNNVVFPSAARQGNIASDPQFLNLSGADFHLKATSPAVDAAMATTAFGGLSPDLDGTARPQGPKAEIGAYELKPAE